MDNKEAGGGEYSLRCRLRVCCAEEVLESGLNRSALRPCVCVLCVRGCGCVLDALLNKRKPCDCGTEIRRRKQKRTHSLLASIIVFLIVIISGIYANKR